MTTLERIKQNRRNWESGNYNCIPFEGLGKIERYIPGIMQSTYYIVTANSGVGKSKLMRSMFVHHPVDWAIKNGKKIKVFLFSFEESKQKFELTEMSRELYTRFKIRKNTRELLSIGRFNTISDDTISKLEQTTPRLNKFFDNVTIIDDARDPDRMFNIVRAYLLRNGSIKMETREEYNPDTNEYEEISFESEYIPNNPEQYTLVVVDHASLIRSKKKTDREAMNYWSDTLALKLRDFYNCTIIDVQQQSAAQESVNNVKAKKLEPSMDGLGDSKLTGRNAEIVLGLFDASRHDLATYGKYDINLLKNNFRMLKIIKDRNGQPGIRMPLYFDGAIDFFHELPKADEMQPIYDVLADTTLTYAEQQEKVKHLLTVNSNTQSTS